MAGLQLENWGCISPPKTSPLPATLRTAVMILCTAEVAPGVLLLCRCGAVPGSTPGTPVGAAQRGMILSSC